MTDDAEEKLNETTRTEYAVLYQYRKKPNQERRPDKIEPKSKADAENIIALFSTPQRYPSEVRKATLLTRTVTTISTDWATPHD